MHIVVVRFSSLGDVVLCSSVFALLRQKLGVGSHISLLTTEAFAPLMRESKDLDEVFEIPRSKGIAGLKELRQCFKNIHEDRAVDLIVDMHGTLRSLAIRAMFPQIPRLWVDKRTIERWLLCGLKMDILSSQGREERPLKYGELLVRRFHRDFAFVFGEKSKDIQYTDQENRRLTQIGTAPSKVNIEALLGENISSEKLISIVPTASFEEKRWSIDSFAKLIKKVLNDNNYQQYTLVVLAGPSDNFCRAFDILETEFPNRFKNLQGKCSIIESAALVAASEICIGNDTGLPHLAEAQGTRSLVILGPTGEQFGFYPHLKGSEFVKKDLWCRPCTTNGKGHCIRSQRFCLELITVEEVFEKIQKMVMA